MGARPRLISSIINSLGSLRMARPSASICCSPPDSSPAGRFISGPRAGKKSVAAAVSTRPLSRASRRFSRTVSWNRMPRFSGTWVTPRRAVRWAWRSPPTGAPQAAIRPSRTLTIPETAISVVVLPAPLGPSRATTSPASTRKSRPRTTATPS